MIDRIEVRSPIDNRELEGAFALREEVFIREEKRARTVEADEYDLTCHHLVAVSDGEVVGTLRLYELQPGDADIKIGRVAVKKSLRGHGVGTRLMEAAHAWAAGRYRSVYLYAHVSAISFYERLGYVAEGEIFEESGAPHIFMRFVAPTDVA